MGWMVRQVLLAKLDLWKCPKLFTLTVDRRRFSDPRAAFEHITGGKFIPRLMRLLGVKRWLWALEFQTLTGDGWPHWHLMIDVGDLPRRRLDLSKAWDLWRRRWDLGGLDLAKKATKIASPEHAVFYITKYLTKAPRGGYPLWVLEAHGMRFVQGSRSLGPLVMKPQKKRDAGDDETDDYAPRKTLLERTSRCRTTSRVWSKEIDYSTGEERLRFLGSLKCSPAQLVALSDAGEISAKLIINVNEKTGKPFIRWLAGDVARTQKQLEELGSAGMVERAAARKKDQILADNVFAQRVAESRIAEHGGEEAEAVDHARRGPDEASGSAGQSGEVEPLEGHRGLGGGRAGAARNDAQSGDRPGGHGSDDAGDVGPGRAAWDRDGGAVGPDRRAAEAVHHGRRNAGREGPEAEEVRNDEPMEGRHDERDAGPPG